MTRYYHCSKCDTVIDAKYARNHPKGELSYVFATDDKDKQKRIEELEQSQDETDEDKEKSKQLESYKASLRGKSMSELSTIHDDLKKQLEDMKKGKTDSKEAKRRRYDVLGYQNMDFDSVCGDSMMRELGSVD